MYKLIKMSMPGWTRVYDTRDAITAAMSLHTCDQCKTECGTSLDDMLSSACGCEFEMIGPADNDEPLTEAEQWDVKMNGYKL